MAKKNEKTQEQIFNRILINIGIAILAYIFLYVLYVKFYMMPSIVCAVIFFILAIAGYIVSAKKLCKYNLKNYAHMFVAFGLCLLFTSLSRITGWLFGLETFMKLIDSSEFIKMLMNSKYEVIIVSWLGAAYLVVMLIYNTALINRLSGKKK